jgi:hypothetical protein
MLKSSVSILEKPHLKIIFNKFKNKESSGFINDGDSLWPSRSMIVEQK